MPCARLASERPGFARFKVARRAAAEFILRKDYRRDWHAELLEEYTYFSQRDFEDELKKLGLRIERVRTRLVEIAPGFVARESPNPSAFRHAGALRELDAQQLLRAAQVGGLFDARLECCVHELLNQRRQRPEPWIGAEIVLREQPFSAGSNEEEVFRPRTRAVWRRLSPAPAAEFLAIREGQFVEEDEGGETLAVGRYEYVLPRKLSTNTIAAIPVVRSGSEVWVGVERRDLPAALELAGSSSILSCPAWRLPRSVTSPSEAQAFVSERLPLDFGVHPLGYHELGDRYFPSPGITPEVVHPFVVELDASSPGSLEWVTLATLIARRRDLLDGHLIALAHRLNHALGGSLASS